MDNTTLTDREEEVYIALATLGAPESTGALAETIGCGNATVSRAINSLLEKGAISAERDGRGILVHTIETAHPADVIVMTKNSRLREWYLSGEDELEEDD